MPNIRIRRRRGGRPVSRRLHSCDRRAAASASAKRPTQSASVTRTAARPRAAGTADAGAARAVAHGLANSRSAAPRSPAPSAPRRATPSPRPGRRSRRARRTPRGPRGHRSSVRSRLRLGPRPVRPHQRRGQPRRSSSRRAIAIASALGDRALLVVADEEQRAAAAGQQLTRSSESSSASGAGGLLEQLDRALVVIPGRRRPPRSRPRCWPAARRRRVPARSAPRRRKALIASSERAGAAAGQADARARSPAAVRIVDAELQRGREQRSAASKSRLRQRGPPGQHGVVDCPPRSVDRRGRAEVVGELGNRARAAGLARSSASADLQVKLGAAQSGQPVIKRAADQLMGEPEDEPARLDLLDHPVGDRLRRALRSSASASRRARRQPGRTRIRDRRELQQLAGGRLRRARRWANDLAHASGLPSSDSVSASCRAGVDRTDHGGVVDRAPQLGDQECVTAGEFVQDPRDLGGRPGCRRRPRWRRTRRSPGAQAPQSQPCDALGAAQVDERRRKRRGDLGLRVTKRRQDQRVGLDAPRARWRSSKSVGVSAQWPSSITITRGVRRPRRTSRSAIALCRRWRSVSGSACARAGESPGDALGEDRA